MNNKSDTAVGTLYRASYEISGLANLTSVQFVKSWNTYLCVWEIGKLMAAQVCACRRNLTYTLISVGTYGSIIFRMYTAQSITRLC